MPEVFGSGPRKPLFKDVTGPEGFIDEQLRLTAITPEEAQSLRDLIAGTYGEAEKAAIQVSLAGEGIYRSHPEEGYSLYLQDTGQGWSMHRHGTGQGWGLTCTVSLRVRRTGIWC